MVLQGSSYQRGGGSSSSYRPTNERTSGRPEANVRGEQAERWDASLGDGGSDHCSVARGSVLALSAVVVLAVYALTPLSTLTWRSSSTENNEAFPISSSNDHRTSSAATASKSTTLLLFGSSKQSKLYTESSTQAVAGLQLPGYPSPHEQLEYERALHSLDWDAVEDDIRTVMTDNDNAHSFWPADYGHYGPLFVRLAWHSCGSYRLSDGRGGCDGGAQRFDPERSWADNTNLDKARKLLQPIKLKYGIGLSWGDLFALAGTIAIESMGGPSLGFCAGRIDVMDNSQTLPLGPTPEQDQFAKCETEGMCPYPLGQNTLGLIYVNPEGPMGQPDPAGAVDTIRDVFGRMDWTGKQLVALIGGGHTFGKAHGASMASPGEKPSVCPFAPWNGPTGPNAITSGFEGPWTTQPTKWDNQYFHNLLAFDWEPVQSPAGHWQWQVKDVDQSPHAPSPDPSSNATQRIMMLTTDIALVVDPEYKKHIEEFAMNQSAFDEEFATAWYKLVTRDMGPYSRCVGPRVPPPQAFQHALPEPPLTHIHHHDRAFVNPNHVAEELRQLVKAHPRGEFVRLARQCANTYRATDYSGGCNGARIRFDPGLHWPINAGLDATLKLLAPIKTKYGDGLSHADLIVLAGNVAAEHAGAPPLTFCPGRTDASNGAAWKHLEYGNTDPPSTVEELLELAKRRGQTAQDVVALTFVEYRSSRALHKLLESDDNTSSGNGGGGNDNDVLTNGLRFYPELRFWAEHYAAAGDKVYGEAFAASWTKLMNADRFDGPVRNVCSARS